MQHQKAVRLEDTVALEEMSIQCKKYKYLTKSWTHVHSFAYFCGLKQEIFWQKENHWKLQEGLVAVNQPRKLNHSLVSLSHLTGFIIQQQSAHDPVHWLHTEPPTATAGLEFTLFRRARWQSRGRQKLRQRFKGMCRTGKFRFNSIAAAKCGLCVGLSFNPDLPNLRYLRVHPTSSW